LCKTQEARRLARAVDELVADGIFKPILETARAIEGGVAMIPPLPMNYDVENRGHFSAGRSRPTKKPTKAKAKPSTTLTFGNDVEGDDGR